MEHVVHKMSDCGFAEGFGDISGVVCEYLWMFSLCLPLILEKFLTLYKKKNTKTQLKVPL